MKDCCINIAMIISIVPENTKEHHIALNYNFSQM